MKKLAIMLLSVALPGLASAEDVFIRIEAKRGAEAAQDAAADWRSRVGELPVVTFPLGSTWTAIGLGPLPREAAEAQMEALKETRSIPADSLLTPAEGIAATPAPAATGETGAASAAGASTAGLTEIPDPVPEQPPAPDRFIRIEAFSDRAQADAALERWRGAVPEAGMWEMPNDWFAIAAGPFSEAGAAQWRDALISGDVIPDDSLIAAQDELGSVAVAGKTPNWPEAPANPPEMPPLAQVQEILGWAGFYDGEIDGQSGPQTRAAIAAALGAQRETPDTATVILNLMENREAWREELGLSTLEDDFTGLSLTAPMERLQHERNDRVLSIYGPKDESGAALILFSQPGGQQEMLDLTGLVTALGWVPSPERDIRNGRASLSGRNETHIGRSEARVADGNVEGWVLIWPVADGDNASRIATEIADSFTRSQPTRAERDAAAGEAEAEAEDTAPDTGISAMPQEGSAE
ncbi:peptidoglycan-binding domain-containing protein [Paracoccus aerodenitrificans]|uniref:peptidoglycan-binding domain-containing protein n=1 Tax=Paracoccus aerodenitrificans TaxID=3017781 RepID=UPI0022F14226|nr:peptidoglycan-binding protein [Paracoccus aerodenitrificans]WBU65393.1 peptidoglycan-binding protein [Paracoccus aerodenitrificans]